MPRRNVIEKHRKTQITTLCYKILVICTLFLEMVFPKFSLISSTANFPIFGTVAFLLRIFVGTIPLVDYINTTVSAV